LTSSALYGIINIVKEKGVFKMKEWTKILKLENREFRITFWYDSYNFLWTSIEEKVARKPTFFNKKDYKYATIRHEYWIDEVEQNPIEVALREIQEHLTAEKAIKEVEKMLDDFCK
jgi:hypothetical protein